MGGETIAPQAAEAASALSWWLEAGVDVAVAEAPRNWLTSTATVSGPVVEPPAPVAAPTENIPGSFAHFREWLAATPSLPLASKTARRVLPKGVEGAPVMLLSEMPGREDSAAGQPISGDAWLLTQRMLAAIGIAADDAYCASLACFHAPATRLAADELEACAVIARRHVAVARPKRLLLLGDAPARALLGKPLAAARDHAHKVEGVRTVATFHPRQLLKRPSDKALAWRDLLLLMEDEG